MIESTEAARELISRCIQHRRQGRSEHVLRSEFLSRLRTLFPDMQDTSWVNHYTEGGEHYTTVSRTVGESRRGFIDTLVHSTVIEFEADLRQTNLRTHGFQQVVDYVAGILKTGTPVSQVRGVLSDTVDWYVYDVEVDSGAALERLTSDQVRLVEAEHFELHQADETTAMQFLKFIRKHLARQQSRQLNADHIAMDLGLDSHHYGRHAQDLQMLIDSARAQDSSVALATELWSSFVDHLERRERGFRSNAFAAEAYLVILARLLCADILMRQALLSDDSELSNILYGEYFETNFRLANMVEHDYFGWMHAPTHIRHILPIAKEIQLDLYAYDFSELPKEDLFGRLMAQLANRTQRKLLGQEWTPAWLGRSLVSACLDELENDKRPQFLDMCCGSGSIIAEILKETRSRWPGLRFRRLCQAATGFDIDPLAVMLAKTTWVVTLADEIRSSTMRVTIPIFHADSLFAVTPVSHRIPLPGEADTIDIALDGKRLSLPAVLISPEYRLVFDAVIDWAHDEAVDAARRGTKEHLTESRTRTTVGNIISQQKIVLRNEQLESLVQAIHGLVRRMATLAIAGRNGIWAFILKNTYRPGLLVGQFNGIVSNPPWLAMSQLADNPYKTQLTQRAGLYGIKPAGASHLHLELATTFLLHAVDRYLSQNAVIGCLLPGTVFNGHHHQPLRNWNFLRSSRKVPLQINQLWDIERGTFRVRAAAVVGLKKNSPRNVTPVIQQGASVSHERTISTTIQVLQLGTNRTAWVMGSEQNGVDTTDEGSGVTQGADLMPRPAVCVEVLNATGAEARVNTPGIHSPWHFTVKDAKKLRGVAFPGSVASCFIHRMVQSLNLLPFVFDGNFVSIAIPARRKNGQWEILDTSAIRGEGFVDTARRFERINTRMANEHVIRPLEEKINERNKLNAQIFPENAFLVLTGAGGGRVCAASLSIGGSTNLVIDQTLYWRLVSSEDEAFYFVGILNSEAVTQAIHPFIPQGEFGERHLHTLPHRVIPRFNPGDTKHRQVVRLTREIAETVQGFLRQDAYLADPSRSISARRRRIRAELENLNQYQELEGVCLSILQT